MGSPLTRQAELGSYRVEIIQNAKIMAQAYAINESGHIIGAREVPNEKMTIFATHYFFANDKESVDLEPADGFTNLEVFALADDDTIVGYISRAIGHPDGSLRACIWKGGKAEPTILPMLDGSRGTHAQDISSAGDIITGYCSSADPARMEPVIWQREAKSGKWNIERLPTKDDYNPFLMMGRVLVSPDGKTIAACCTEERMDFGRVNSQLTYWTKAKGKWTQTIASKDQFLLRDINNAGQMAASYTDRKGTVPCVCDLDGKMTKIPLLEGDDRGQAWAIDNEGVVYGISDDPSRTTRRSPGVCFLRRKVQARRFWRLPI